MNVLFGLVEIHICRLGCLQYMLMLNLTAKSLKVRYFGINKYNVQKYVTWIIGNSKPFSTTRRYNILKYGAVNLNR
jgi:hypothetical protein